MDIEFLTNAPSKKLETLGDGSSVDDTESLSLSAAEELSCCNSTQVHLPENHEDESESCIEVQLESENPIQYESENETCSLSSDESNTLQRTDPKGPSKFPRSVRFCLDKNLYHPPSVYDMTEEECTACWYHKESKDLFREESASSARKAFLKKQSFSYSYFFSWFQQATPDFNEFADCILDAYDSCAEPELEMDNLEPTGSVIGLSTVSSFVPDYSYQQQPYRQSLCDMYSSCDDIPGLEHFILSPFRGEPESLRTYVLDQARFRLQRNRSCDPTSLTSECSRLDQPFRHEDGITNTLAYVSRCISRPSRLLAHEFGKALAESLQQEL